MNYSTTALREVFALGEARERSETVTDRLGPSWFVMAWLSARTDLIDVQLLMDDLAPVERSWEGVWDEAMAVDAWERWIVTGRLAAGRAEMELALGRLDDAVTWSGRALELATRGRREKYEVMARIVLGRALTARRDVEGATAELRTAVSLADGLGSPLLRWRARAALAAADRSAEDASREAREIIEEVAGGLSPERAKAYLAAAPVEEALELTR